jgi:hypothetical protein
MWKRDATFSVGVFFAGSMIYEKFFDWTFFIFLWKIISFLIYPQINIFLSLSIQNLLFLKLKLIDSIYERNFEIRRDQVIDWLIDILNCDCQYFKESKNVIKESLNESLEVNFWAILNEFSRRRFSGKAHSIKAPKSHIQFKVLQTNLIIL